MNLRSCSTRSLIGRPRTTSISLWPQSSKSLSRKRTSKGRKTRTRKRPRTKERPVELLRLGPLTRMLQSIWSSSILRRTTLSPIASSCLHSDQASRLVCIGLCCRGLCRSLTCSSPCPWRKLTRSVMSKWTTFTCSDTSLTVSSNSTCSSPRKIQNYTFLVRTLSVNAKVSQ